MTHNRFELIQETMQAITPFYRPVVTAILADGAFPGASFWISQIAMAMDPAPFTLATFGGFSPYIAGERRSELLQQAVDAGALRERAAGSYTVTDQGLKAVNRFFTGARRAMAELDPLPTVDMRRLASLLERVLNATLAVSPPEDKRHLQTSRHFDPGDTAPAIVRIDQFLTDLVLFRDDAHIAAWQPLGVPGPAWEALTVLWRDGAASSEDLAERLANRGISVATYAEYLQDLMQKGWLQYEDDQYRVSATGRSLREQVEETTDVYYYAGWAVLNDEEARELDDLLEKLRDELQALALDERARALSDLYELAGELSGAIYTLTRSRVDPVLAALALSGPRLAVGLLWARTYRPQPVNGALVGRRSPYTNPVIFEESLQSLVDLGLLQVMDDGYGLTRQGDEHVDAFISAFHTGLEELSSGLDASIPPDRQRRLADLLAQVISASLQAPEPPGNLHISHSHALYAGDDAHPLSRIDQYLDDLNAFRDDAHIASFAMHQISGPAWELFSTLWQEEVRNAMEMTARVQAYRGYDQDTYTQALAELQERGWVTPDIDDHFVLTAAGKEVRAMAERLTNRYFYQPWNALNEAETEELRTLMQQLKVGLDRLATPAEVESGQAQS